MNDLSTYPSAVPLLAILVSAASVPLIGISARRPNLREFWTLLAAGAKFALVLSLLPSVLVNRGGGDSTVSDLTRNRPDLESRSVRGFLRAHRFRSVDSDFVLFHWICPGSQGTSPDPLLCQFCPVPFGDPGCGLRRQPADLRHLFRSPDHCYLSAGDSQANPRGHRGRPQVPGVYPDGRGGVGGCHGHHAGS